MLMKRYIILICLFYSNFTFAQWQISSFQNTIQFLEVDFPSSDAAYIIGNAGVLLKSTDEGKNWTQIYDFGAFTQPKDLHFLNADTGFVNIYSNHFRTFDGGITWSSFAFVPRIKYFQNHLFTTYTSNDTSYIKKSTDLGNTWTTLFQFYQNANSGYILSVLNDTTAFFFHVDDKFTWYKTTDAFSTIDTILITNGSLEFQDQFDFIDMEHGYHYGSINPLSYPSRTWGVGTFFYPIALDNWGALPVLDLKYIASRLYATSLYGKIFYSTNFGQTWVEQLAPINEPIFSISFLNSNKAIAVGQYKIIYTDNASSINSKDFNSQQNLISCYPNPVKDNFIIENKSGHELRFELYNLFGQKLIETNITKNRNHIAMQKLPSNIFYYTLKNENIIYKSGTISKID